MKTLVIINPVSGKQQRSNEEWISPVKLNFPHAKIEFTLYAEHASELAAKAVEEGYEQVLVAGGDGTINEAARSLINTSVSLGIIPKGSGNGLARELGMPLRYEEALVALQNAKSVPCDVGVANEEYFLNVAGIGIEAEIAHQFAEHGKQGKRGMLPYFTLGAKAFLNYHPKTLHVSYADKQISCAPLTLVFANGTQYGSGFYIAPQASLSDGKLDMVEVLAVPKWKLLYHLFDFFQKNPLPLEIAQTSRVEQALITSDGEIVYHIDGEPKTTQNQLSIRVLPKALHLLRPTR